MAQECPQDQGPFLDPDDAFSQKTLKKTELFGTNVHEGVIMFSWRLGVS